MKLLTVLVVAFACVAQTAAPEPEFADIFFRLDNGALVPLERQAAAIKGGASGFIVMSIKVASELPGGKSPVRFKGGTALEFVVRSTLRTGAVDPNTIYCLRRLKPKKRTRELLITTGHASPVGASTTTTPAEGVLPVEFSKYGTSSLKMTTGVLPAGEYAVGHPYGPAVFCFGVD